MRWNESVVYAAMVFLTLLAAGPLPAKGAELTGFGSIKFGMTKEEAWAAIDGKGKWEKEGKWLRYEYALHDRIGPTMHVDGLKLEVVQTFHDNLASDVVVEIYSNLIHLPSCASEMFYFISAIQHKYGKPTLVRDNVVDQVQGKRDDRTGATIFRIFAFDDEALIRVLFEAVEGEPPYWNCGLQVWYHPPRTEPNSLLIYPNAVCSGEDGGHSDRRSYGSKAWSIV